MKFGFKLHLMLLELIVIYGIKGNEVTNKMYASVAVSTTSKTEIPSANSVHHTEFCKDRNWTRYKSNCYQVFKTFNYFHDAEKLCKDKGAYLVSIGDHNENNVIQKLVEENTRYKEAWIGLRFNKQKNTFEWLDKVTKYLYQNWMYEKYSNNGECAEMIPGGMWSKDVCNKKSQFVCERAYTEAKKDDSSTKLIIMITLPLSCVSIMMMFVGYLCFRSHQEIKSLPSKHRKCSQHFVDVVSNNASIGTEGLINSIPQITEPAQLELTDENSNDDSKGNMYPEKKTRTYASPNGSEKMYKQVTFV